MTGSAGHPSATGPLCGKGYTHLQLIGTLLAIPAAAGGTYSVYRKFFAADVACHNLQVGIISVMEKNVPADVNRGLLIKDVTEFDQKCSRIDPDSHAIFQAAIQPPRPEPTAKPASATQVAAGSPADTPVSAAKTDGFAASAASTFGKSASGDVRGWVALTRGESDRVGEPNFDGFALSLTALPPRGTVLKAATWCRCGPSRNSARTITPSYRAACRLAPAFA